jgi:transposase
VVQLAEVMMILDLHRQGLSVTAIARRTARDPKTVRTYIERGLELPVYGPRSAGRPGKLLPFAQFIRERLDAFPDLTATRLLREIRERGYKGAYTAVKRFIAAIPARMMAPSSYTTTGDVVRRPFTGAWIETAYQSPTALDTRASMPVRVILDRSKSV